MAGDGKGQKRQVKGGREESAGMKGGVDEMLVDRCVKSERNTSRLCN